MLFRLGKFEQRVNLDGTLVVRLAVPEKFRFGLDPRQTRNDTTMNCRRKVANFSAIFPDLPDGPSG